MALTFPDGDLGRLELWPPRRPPPSPLSLPLIALVLVVVGVSSWLLARSLAGPLGKLSAAARALGRGELTARADVARGDELGDVARAFDDMAARVGDLLRAEKELIANVSHELRTPLARIRVALDLAAEGDAATAKESLADIQEDLEELERLISDVLTAARLDVGGPSGGIPPLRRQTVDVGALLARAVERFRSAHPDREIELEIDDDLPSLEGDPVLLRRAVDNLIDNARKYSNSCVTLRARRDEGVLVEVSDRGIGMGAEDLARAFQPFFRADRSRARGGLGLGLALARRIVEAHGGALDLESEPDEGTTARIHLPLPSPLAPRGGPGG
jgi:signal transduction histidine kinase